jgi:glycyl-tRNA synthetase beta subunit
LPSCLPKESTAIYWPKNMYWRKPGERFVRPVRWLVALLDDETIPLEFDGVRAGNQFARAPDSDGMLGENAVTIPRAGAAYFDCCERLRFWGAASASIRFARRWMPLHAPGSRRALA